MNSPMRWTPTVSMRGATSTNTRAVAIGGGSVSAMAVSDEMPPSDAPTIAGVCDNDRETATTSRAKASRL